MPQIPRVYLKKNEDRRQRIGHPWVFSNEIERFDGSAEDGALADVYSQGGTFLGRGYLNRKSLIAIRVLTREPEEVGRQFFRNRIARAIEARRPFAGERDAMRMVFSEADYLPGLVVDRYGEDLAVQVTTLGMERQRELLLDLLEDIFRPRSIVLRNDTNARAQENLPFERTVARGEYPGAGVLRDISLFAIADLINGQKTGLYLDQSENRVLLSDIVQDKNVLDCFCYSGAWGIEAARRGARHATLIDSSPRALEMAERCVELNGVSGKCSLVHENCFSYLSRLVVLGDKFDVVIVDPPGLVKSKRKMRAGVEIYERINTDAMKLVTPGGFLVTCSCSHNVDRETFLSLLARSARRAGREAQIVSIRSQSRDHPILLPGRISEYLKCVLVRLW
ncbi:MAG: class I SAM-dependent rRNA methyltransferase [Candidatus Eisenbacteria bacterium]|nr:class I SAM-dependent rRNA methyltransferase [Candidatus Eisenbacteria bacterium]